MKDWQIEELIYDDNAYSSEYFVYLANNPEATLTNFFESKIKHHLEEKAIVLAIHLGISYSDAESKVDSEEYLVLDDDEADKIVKDRARDRLEDELYHVPKHLHQYFNDEEYIDDLIQDRGHLLAYADGEEYEETYNDTTYYIYQQ